MWARNSDDNSAIERSRFNRLAIFLAFVDRPPPSGTGTGARESTCVAAARCPYSSESARTRTRCSIVTSSSLPKDFRSILQRDETCPTWRCKDDFARGQDGLVLVCMNFLFWRQGRAPGATGSSSSGCAVLKVSTVSAGTWTFLPAVTA